MQNLLLLKQIKDAQALEKRKRRLFNRIYRRTFFFKATWVCRLLYSFLFFFVAFTHNIPKTSRKEVVIAKSVDVYNSYTKGGTRVQTRYLKFTTNYGTYERSFTRTYLPDFEIDDTLIIERNYYNKVIFFTKIGWALKYGFSTHFQFYYLVFFATFLSFFYNDGFYKQTRQIILAICIVNLLTLVAYFLI